MSTEPSVNPWRKFQQLLPGGLRTVGVVASNNGDGTSTVTLRDGSNITVAGEGVVQGDSALIVDGVLGAKVPALVQVGVTV